MATLYFKPKHKHICNTPEGMWKRDCPACVEWIKSPPSLCRPLMLVTAPEGRANGKAMNYQEYLQSDGWKARRAKFFGKECVAECGSLGRELHHMSYGLLGREGRKHVMWLCRSCHQTLHDWNGEQKVKMKRMRMLLKRLRKENRLAKGNSTG